VSETQETFSLDHLPERDRAQLKSLLLQYADIFSDLLDKTKLCTHNIELKSGTLVQLACRRTESIQKNLNRFVKN